MKARGKDGGKGRKKEHRGGSLIYQKPTAENTFFMEKSFLE